MGLSQIHLNGLRIFEPSSLISTLEFFEFLRYDTKDFRNTDVIDVDELSDAFLNNSKVKQKTNYAKVQRKKSFDEFLVNIDKCLMIKYVKDSITEIKWKRIDGFCKILRLTKRSDERKTRWALFYLFSAKKSSITNNQIQTTLGDVKVLNLEKSLKKILKSETFSGLDATYDGKLFKINHGVNDKLVNHYLADAIEEPSRRSPGELEEETLTLLDEGSYSNQEIAEALKIDEAVVSRTLKKLREQEKIVLSSFGKRGARYFTTNCDNCPFGTTKSSCRKEALSYIIEAFNEEFGIDLNATDFDNIDANQAILKIQRIVMISRKEKDTKLERNLSENLSELLSKVVDKSLEIGQFGKKESMPEIKMKLSPMTKLPVLYQLGLLKGAKSGVHLMDEMLRIVSKSIKKEDRLKIKKQALIESNKFLKTLSLENSS